ncbi:hypothetical protein DASC09_052810 [Saccharomycopsis crataegensis]|uniref:GH18 domain-containing protein n=1 Tax=Saccharomycopsis crataegensis TaxID=43959 RepID=A0AAV5QTW3_9ASCO|nr:hypothetical protein DASC09_052810 [Saccharomycopsis crataegensis]
MYLNILLFLLLWFNRLSPVSGKYTTDGPNIAVYWGQGAYQKSLGAYCKTQDVDIIVLSFINDFSIKGVSYNFGNGCDASSVDGTCEEMAHDIKVCQELGVKVIISIGGQNGEYGISSTVDAKLLANQFHDMLGDPDGTIFPGVMIDGVDLDIEKGRHGGFVDFVQEIKRLFAPGFLVTAAPQCVFPDKNIGDAIRLADIDLLFVQFYNNYCNVDQQFNFQTWSQAVSEVFANKRMKVYVGLPGSTEAAGSGYVNLTQLSTLTTEARNDHRFGGFSVWDAKRGFENIVDDSNGNGNRSYISGLRRILHNSSTNISVIDGNIKSPATTAIATTTTTITPLLTTDGQQEDHVVLFSSKLTNQGLQLIVQ